MDHLKDNLEAALKQSPDFSKLKDHVQMSVTGDGLRIEMTETEKGLFFQSGSPDPTKTGSELIHKLAEELGKLPNDIVIEGHTDAKPFNGRSGYSNWELSADRANSSRREMETHGLREGQVVQVRGFASQNLRDKENPNSPANRRVSVIVKYQNAVAEVLPPSKEGDAEGGEKPAASEKPAEEKAAKEGGHEKPAEHK
jgi:chemotaxis protein MotB